ncbi:unnamed protein product, partial [Amoebophrya sp. A120]
GSTVSGDVLLACTGPTFGLADHTQPEWASHTLSFQHMLPESVVADFFRDAPRIASNELDTHIWREEPALAPPPSPVPAPGERGLHYEVPGETSHRAVVGTTTSEAHEAGHAEAENAAGTAAQESQQLDTAQSVAALSLCP